MDTTTTHSKKTQQLADLPEELLVRIALTLSDGDLARLARTSRAMYRICWSHWVWHRRFVYRFSQRFLLSKIKDQRHSPTPEARPPKGPSSTADSIGSDNAVQRQDEEEEEEQDSVGDEEDYNHDDSERGRNVDKGKRRKRSRTPLIQIQRTADVSLETLLELYQKYSRLVIPAEDMSICHMGNRYWVMEPTGQSRFGKIATLRSVWWLDVHAVFYGVPKGRYRLRWRMKVTSNGPVVGTQFVAKLVNPTELDIGKAFSEPEVLRFIPEDMDSFKQHTNAESSTVRRSIKKLIPGFTIFEVPGVIQNDDSFSTLIVQIQNHDGWKSGMHLDYVQLVQEEDVAKVDQEQASEAARLEAHNEDINDEGEEYYPRFWPVLPGPLGGFRGGTFNWFRKSDFVDGYGSSQPSIVRSGSSSTATPAEQQGSLPEQQESRQEQQESPPEQQGSPPHPPPPPPTQGGQADDLWYRILPWMLLYCVYIYFTN